MTGGKNELRGPCRCHPVGDADRLRGAFCRGCDALLVGYQEDGYCYRCASERRALKEPQEPFPWGEILDGLTYYSIWAAVFYLIYHVVFRW